MQPIIRMEHITKRFASVVANNQVDFECYPGEVLCLLGENGAGKTTLMNVLYGRYRPDEGAIYHEGRKVAFSNPREAIATGIQMVHQHFMLVNPLTVADNIVMGKEPKRYGLYDRKKAVQIAADLSREYGLTVPPDKPIADLSVGEMQRVEIIKALYQGAQVLILDEPTASLTPQEVEELFRVINTLKSSGKSIIFITHKLHETMAVSDRICVMRNGRMVARRQTAETSIGELSELMVGERITRRERAREYSDEVMLGMANVVLQNAYKKNVLDGVNLELHKGEILGIAGVDGNGQQELMAVLSGVEQGWQGEISYQGQTLAGVPVKQRITDGISCIFADRHKYGIAADSTAMQNYLMGYHHDQEYFSHKWMINWPKVRTDAEAMLETYDVRPRNINMNLGNFSGGNQQKYVVGHAMKHARLLVAALPTRGVDVKAADFIHEQIVKVKEAGGAVLLISSDLDEILALSDRVAVLYDGKIVDCRPTGEYTDMLLGSLMGGHTDALQ